jgi:hypothetical protein
MKPVSKDVVRMATVGYICLQWAAFEAIVATAIWEMLGLEEDVGRIVTGGLDMRPRLNMAVRLAEKLKMPGPYTQALIDARKAMDDGLEARRNFVVHGIHQWREDRDSPLVLDLHRGKRTKPEPFTDEQLQELADDLRDAMTAMAAGLSPLCLSMADQMLKAAREAGSVSGSQSDKA